MNSNNTSRVHRVWKGEFDIAEFPEGSTVVEDGAYVIVTEPETKPVVQYVLDMDSAERPSWLSERSFDAVFGAAATARVVGSNTCMTRDAHGNEWRAQRRDGAGALYDVELVVISRG